MTTELYQITFSGEILPGFDRADVSHNIQTLFRISEDRAERLFSAGQSVIKSAISHSEALHYRNKLTEAGADVTISRIPSKPAVADSQTAVASNEPASLTRQTDTDLRHSPVEFTGRGGEYFRVWIVNILLTIVTLGIYSAWATVRDRQYFYGNTQLDGASFQYLASPIAILKGRLIALAALIAYFAISEFFFEAGIALAIGFIFVVPWIVLRSLRFNAINSAYRNVRFDFQATYGQAFMVTFVWPVLNVLTLLILTPFSTLKTHRFIANGSRYGTTPFSLGNNTAQYYRLFGKGILLVIGFGAAAYLASYLIVPLAGIIVAAVGYLVTIAYFMTAVPNLFLNGVELDSHGFESRLQLVDMGWLYLTNSLLIALTLGLYTPWAKVRLAKYRAECTAMLIDGDLNRFAAAESQRTSALGQELGDAFDVDFAAI